MPAIPDPAAEPVSCNSWVIVSHATGLPVLETYDRATAEAINRDRYEVLTTYVWLARFNRSIKES